MVLRPIGEDGGVVDGVSHSRFDSPVSCRDVSRVHGLHTTLHREKVGSEEDMFEKRDNYSG
jgi:hypothetical protein